MKMMTPMKNKMSPAPIGVAPLPEEHGETKMNVQDMMDGGGSIQLNVSDYPQLTGIEAGAEVSGKWNGNVDAAPDEDGNVTVRFSTMEIETDNAADRALEELSNKSEQTGGDEGDDEL